MRGGFVESSFVDWYAGEHAKLVATMVLATGDLDLATEAADEAFARALQRWDRVGRMESPSGWTFRVAINHARRVARRRSLERNLLLRRQPQGTVPAPAGEVWHLVSRLSRRQREVVVLRYVADLPEAVIADVLAISRSTVSSTLADAHARLNQQLTTTREEIMHG